MKNLVSFLFSWQFIIIACLALLVFLFINYMFKKEKEKKYEEKTKKLWFLVLISSSFLLIFFLVFEKLIRLEIIQAPKVWEFKWYALTIISILFIISLIRMDNIEKKDSKEIYDTNLKKTWK